jgi:hypothetical protein
MGEKFDKYILSPLKTNIFVVFVLIAILYSDNSIQQSIFDNPIALISISIVSFLACFRGTVKPYGDIPFLLLYGIYIVTIYGYTFYQWQISSKKTDTDCSLTIPRTKNYSKSQYYLYRIMYLTTIIVIVVLIQNLLDKGGDLPTFMGRDAQDLVVILPFLLPAMTEMINELVGLFSSTEYSINPESLLVNFMLGDSKKDLLDGRLIGPIIFYLLLMAYAYYSSYYEQSPWPIYILLIFVMGFSVWMRAIFVQDCSLKENKDISKVKAEDLKGVACIFEKYGGLQAIFATCFMINMLSYIKNPTYKLFIFSIIGLGSGFLSSLFIMNLK